MYAKWRLLASIRVDSRLPFSAFGSLGISDHLESLKNDQPDAPATILSICMQSSPAYVPSTYPATASNAPTGASEG